MFTVLFRFAASDFTARRYALARSLLSAGVHPSVRPSVCPTVTLVYCIQMAEYIVKLFSRTGSSIIMFFFTPNTSTQFQGEPLQRGR